MITRKNLSEVVKAIPLQYRKRILNSDKEYCVLELHIFNVGSVTTFKLTDNFNRYKNVGNRGDCILYTEEVVEILKNEHN